MEVSGLARCKTCGRQYNIVQAMTYSAYGYCSWDCLMKHSRGSNNRNRDNRKSGGHRTQAGYRTR